LKPALCEPRALDDSRRAWIKHVFVETNWVVDYCDPAHQRARAAIKLLESANSGTINLHLPAPCLAEARSVIRVKFQPREADTLREYLKWAKANGHVEAAMEEATRRVLDQFEGLVKRDLDNLEARIEGLKAEKGLHIFPLNTDMLEQSVSLATEKLDLKPYDNSILAAVLARARELAQKGARDLAFCELDGDLQPWDKYGRSKPVLTRLYDDAHIWVYGDFTMTTPEPPENW
jgi:predicted nucleic acid-binding protein